MNYKRLIGIWLLCAFLLLGCAPRPNTSYYEDLYYLVYRMQFSLQPVGYDPKALNANLKIELQQEIDNFLSSNLRYRRLGTYYILNLLSIRMHGGTIYGDLGWGDDPAPTWLEGGLYELLHKTKNGYSTEYQRYGVSIDLAAIEKRARDSLQQTQ